MVFERFTNRARRVVVLAQEEAKMLNHNYIGTEHILLGLIHEGEGVAAKALESLGIALEGVRQQVEEIIGQGQQVPSGHIPFTPRAKKVLELSPREALQLRHNYVGTEHILLGLIREGEGVAAQVLVKLGADLNRVRQQVLILLSGYKGEPRAEAGEEKSLSSAKPSIRNPTIVAKDLVDTIIEELKRGRMTEKQARDLARDFAELLPVHDRSDMSTKFEAGILRPPDETTNEPSVQLEALNKRIAMVGAAKEAAIEMTNFELAAKMRDLEKRLLLDRSALEKSRPRECHVEESTHREPAKNGVQEAVTRAPSDRSRTSVSYPLADSDQVDTGAQLGAERKNPESLPTNDPAVPARSGRVFISYRREDTSHVAGRLSDRLIDQLGESQVFIDVDSIEFGVDYREVISNAVGKCDVLLAVIGHQWVTIEDENGECRLFEADDLVRLEIEAALKRNIRVIPVLVDGAAMPKVQNLPPSLSTLARRNALQIRHETFRQDAQRLLQAVQKVLESLAG
jgi:Clp amino terminal domain, pathogenicity island component/TIR domain